VTVHVWKGKTYIGQVFTSGSRGFTPADHLIGVQADDENEGEKIKQLLLRGQSDYLEVRSGARKTIELEFPSEDWLAVTCLMVLPAEGYRVHIIRDANK
jgi:hypothetical protein